ncbi:ficolin-3-like [Patiria miniata]|uniref:Fibrinogen C-terminal domain-containing protein n=1 Tax=Patiria miniata TaxID=46514 RepID=A0A914AEW8_PATMI|nr:ficolin-3-like [Patiria miniata]
MRLEELRIYAGVVESQLRTCYFGPPPEPLPGEHWMQAATREIRKRCPGTQVSTDDNNGTEAEGDAETLTTPSSPRYAYCSDRDDDNDGDVVIIYPAQYPGGLYVSCSGKWIVIQRRYVAAVNFTRSWAEYRDGFGDLENSFWLGNEIVRQLTSEGTWELKVALTSLDNPGSWAAVYLRDFQIVGDEYQLLASINPSYSMGHSLIDVHTGQLFSTYDHDNDDDGNANCAAELKGGWWFKTCTGGVGTEDLVPSNLNGEYSYPVNYTGQDYRGMRWASAFDGRMSCEISIHRYL